MVRGGGGRRGGEHGEHQELIRKDVRVGRPYRERPVLAVVDLGQKHIKSGLTRATVITLPDERAHGEVGLVQDVFAVVVGRPVGEERGEPTGMTVRG